MAIFESNELMTERINKKHEQGLVSYTTALNDLADLTDEEFMVMNGLRLPNQTGRERRQAFGGFYKYNKTERLPNQVDWRKKGVVTSVKAQGECGSCYAFAAVAALEAYHKQKTGRLLDLSLIISRRLEDFLIYPRLEDFLIYPLKTLLTVHGTSVTRVVMEALCSGSLSNLPKIYSLAFKYASQKGIAMESKYPYIENEQRCKWRQSIAVAKDNGFNEIKPGDELGLKHAVAKRGPVAVGICGSKRSFRFYKDVLITMFAFNYISYFHSSISDTSGVYSNEKCGRPDHGVLVVGYGTDRSHGDYWIVKNRFASTHLLNCYRWLNFIV
ncbi:unnamed protein product, partial [Wuchereria bancrofti]